MCRIRKLIRGYPFQVSIRKYRMALRAFAYPPMWPVGHNRASISVRQQMGSIKAAKTNKQIGNMVET